MSKEAEEVRKTVREGYGEIAKSGPEHYADISFFTRRLGLADLGKVIKSCFEFLLQEIAPYSKRNFVFFRIVWHKSARCMWGFGEKYLRVRHEISVSSYAVIRTNCIVPFSVERVGTNIYLCDLLF